MQLANYAVQGLFQTISINRMITKLKEKTFPNLKQMGEMTYIKTVTIEYIVSLNMITAVGWCGRNDETVEKMLKPFLLRTVTMPTIWTGRLTSFRASKPNYCAND